MACGTRAGEKSEWEGHGEQRHPASPLTHSPNVSVPPHSDVETLSPNVIVSGSGTFER